MPQLFMWGLSISKAPPSLKCDSLVTGKNTGYLSRGTNERFPTFCDIKDLRAEFPSRKTGNLRKRSSELISPIRVVSRQIRVKQLCDGPGSLDSFRGGI